MKPKRLFKNYKGNNSKEINRKALIFLKQEHLTNNIYAKQEKIILKLYSKIRIRNQNIFSTIKKGNNFKGIIP